MKQRNKGIIAALITAAAIWSGCSKEAGEGGLASIRGKVYAINLTSGGAYDSEGYAGDERVSIAADGEISPFADVRTNYEGAFEFKDLRKGTYKVWVFSRCDTCNINDTTVIQTVTIKERKEAIALPDFHIIK